MAGAGVLKCSFCRKGQDRVQRLIAGPGVYICDECIELCNEILAEGPPPPAPVERVPRLRERLAAFVRTLRPATAR